jgi:hypothetical protein
MMTNFDWTKFWLHFGFGAILVFLINLAQGFSGSIVLTIIVALGVGVVGGIYGDRFWRWFLRHIRWF